MTLRSGHGTHLRLISSLERWGCCSVCYNAKFKLFPSDGVVVGTRWRFNTNDTWWSTYVNRLSKTCFVNITNHEAGNLNCWVGPEYTSSPLLSWTECMLQHRFSSAELNIQGRFNSWVYLELNVCPLRVDPRLHVICFKRLKSNYWNAGI